MTGAGGGGEEEEGRRNTASTVSSSGEGGSSQGLVVTTTSHSSSRGCREEVGEVGEWRGVEVVEEERCHCFSLCLTTTQAESGASWSRLMVRQPHRPSHSDPSRKQTAASV